MTETHTTLTAFNDKGAILIEWHEPRHADRIAWCLSESFEAMDAIDGISVPGIGIVRRAGDLQNAHYYGLGVIGSMLFTWQDLTTGEFVIGSVTKLRDAIEAACA